jgi:hypothetical protein
MNKYEDNEEFELTYMVDGSLNLYSHLGKLAILTEAKYMPHS